MNDDSKPERPRRILIIEDDPVFAYGLERLLVQNGFEALLAADAASGRTLALTAGPDLVVLDRGLPGGDGLEVARAIRAAKSIPILMLTARSEVTDRVDGLESGADDYLTKPFDFRELLARVRSLLRRSTQSVSSSVPLTFGPFTVMIEARVVMRDGITLNLTRTEFDLLVYFMRNLGVVLSQAKLLETVWGYTSSGYERTLITHIRRLRKKVEPDPDRPVFIQTVHGAGYRFGNGKQTDMAPEIGS